MKLRLLVWSSEGHPWVSEFHLCSFPDTYIPESGCTCPSSSSPATAMKRSWYGIKGPAAHMTVTRVQREWMSGLSLQNNMQWQRSVKTERRTSLDQLTLHWSKNTNNSWRQWFVKAEMYSSIFRGAYLRFRKETQSSIERQCEDLSCSVSLKRTSTKRISLYGCLAPPSAPVHFSF